MLRTRRVNFSLPCEVVVPCLFPGSCFNSSFSVETKFPSMLMLNPKSLQFVFHHVGTAFLISLKSDL